VCVSGADLFHAYNNHKGFLPCSRLWYLHFLSFFPFLSFPIVSHISRRQYKQLTHLMTQSRDDSCQLDTATNLQGENFRPLQNATIVVNKQNGNNNNNNDRDTSEEGPQLVSHCTSDDFFVMTYSSDEQ
jgi:hypothetical protein